MKRRCARFRPRARCGSGFTLAELLVSMVVLLILVVLAAQLINNTTALTGQSGRSMDADAQARLVLDRVSADFARFDRRGGMDSLFAKIDGGGSADPNDKLFFYSTGTGFYSTAGTFTAQDNTGFSLVGYRVGTPNANLPKSLQLERLGKTLTWTGGYTPAPSPLPPGGTGGAPGSPLFLSFPANSLFPFPASTLAGAYGTAIGTNPPAYSNGVDGDYHVLGEQVFRLEFCFLLRDGTLANRPLRDRAANPVLGMPRWTVTAGLPTAAADATQGYAAGPAGSGAASLWFNDTVGAKRVYRCASAEKGAAVWVPGGLEGVSAIVVAIATLDNVNRVRAPDTVRIALTLPDPTDAELVGTPPRTMAVTWNQAVVQPNFAASAGIPPSVAASIRIYQRFIYLNE